MIGTGLKAALKTAYDNRDNWLDGSVIALLSDGSYDAVPPAYLNDVSWSNRSYFVEEAGRFEGDLDDWGVDQDAIDSLTDDEIMDYLYDTISQLQDPKFP